MEITGKIIQALPLQSGVSKAGSNWQLQTYILETMEQYPRKVAIELFNRNADQYKCNVDDVVTVSFDLESREFNGRWYTSVRAWRIDHNQAGTQPGAMPAAPQQTAAPQQPASQQQPSAPQQPQAQQPAEQQAFTNTPDESSDMPF